MILLKSRTVLNLLALLIGALTLWSCGGNGTASPTIGHSVVAVQITPSPGLTYPTGTEQFTATVSGTSNQAVTWSVLGDNGGSISSTGLFTAPGDDLVIAKNATSKTANSKPATKTKRDTVQYTIQATSVADPTKYATAIVNVTDLTVTVTPSDPTVVEGATVQLAANVTGVPGVSQAVTWYAPNLGTISSNGLYTAPLTPGTNGVVAYSVAENGAQGFTDVTVVPPSGITIQLTPASASTGLGGTVQYTATVSGTANTAVTYAVVLVGQTQYGSISTSGLYTAPTFLGSSSQVVQITATSVADPSKVATATVTVFNDSGTPGPAGAVPYMVGLLGALYRRRKAAR